MNRAESKGYLIGRREVEDLLLESRAARIQIQELHERALARVDVLAKKLHEAEKALGDLEAKASLGAKMTDCEHPKIADGFIGIATYAHNALAAIKQPEVSVR